MTEHEKTWKEMMTEREKAWEETMEEMDDFIKNRMLTKKFFNRTVAICLIVMALVMIYAFVTIYMKLLTIT